MGRKCTTSGLRPWMIVLCLYVVLLFMTIRSQNFRNGCHDSETFKQSTAHRQVKKTAVRRVGREGKNKHFPVIKLEKGISCAQRKDGDLSLSNQILPLTALASPFRSGNTWFRHLLQMATGIGTSSVYCDTQLQEKGFPYECSHESFNRTIVVKTHESGARDEVPDLEFDRVVLLIRDPYNFIVANRHTGHLDEAKEENYFEERWRKNQPWWLDWWNKVNDFWLIKFKGPVYPLLYSNLLNDTETEVRKVLNFLRVAYTEADIRCAIDNKEGNFHRKHFVWTRIKDITELFDNSMKARIASTVKTLSTHLKKKYRVNWVNETHSVRE